MIDRIFDGLERDFKRITSWLLAILGLLLVYGAYRLLTEVVLPFFFKKVIPFSVHAFYSILALSCFAVTATIFWLVIFHRLIGYRVLKKRLLLFVAGCFYFAPEFYHGGAKTAEAAYFYSLPTQYADGLLVIIQFTLILYVLAHYRCTQYRKTPFFEVPPLFLGVSRSDHKVPMWLENIVCLMTSIALIKFADEAIGVFFLLGSLGMMVLSATRGEHWATWPASRRSESEQSGEYQRPPHDPGRTHDVG